MANIHIKELFGSDNITDLTEKVNFNFDQLILAGGGPEGPVGPTGDDGVAGPEGLRGSQWVAGFGATTINLPTDGVYRKNDFLLDDGGSFVGGATGQVFYYNSTTWVDTGINLKGPKGDQGPEGIGAISIIPGKSYFGGFTPNNNVGTKTIGNYINTIVPPEDEDDYDKSSAGYINAGLDFAVIGYGNNSLVLGRYATLFETGGVGSKLNPPGTNAVLDNFPSSEADVPMLLVSQNDYKNPAQTDNIYKNGISIGLTKSHPNADYATGDGMSGFVPDYTRYANISIENKHHDFKISSYQILTLTSNINENLFRLGSTTVRTGQSLDARSTKLKSDQYTNFKINNSFFTDLSDSGGVTSTNEFITNAQSTFFQNSKIYQADAYGTTKNDSREFVAKTFIGTKNDSGGVGANELVFFNGDSLTTDSDGKKISKTLDPTTSGSTPSDFNTRSIFDSDNKNFVFRIGQTTVQPGKMIGGTTGEPTLESNYNNKINITYQGQGYDTPFIQYSGIDIFNTYNNSINSGAYDHYSPYATIPNNSTLSQALGYDIREPLQWDISQSNEGSISMTRMGIYPGFFRRKKSSGIYDGNAQARQKKFFDVAHRMMPTGSLDLFGTVRIREQETTDNGAKDGWLVVNKKDGILGFQDPNSSTTGSIGTPTFAIIMFPEMASNKFSFYIESSKQFGASSSQVGDGKAYNYVFPQGGTSRGAPFAAFPGKGSDELKDYYMCNGAVLADSRDIIATGPYSKMKGMNVSANNGSSKIQNGVTMPTSGVTDFDYEKNPDFEGINGQTHDSSPQSPLSLGNWSDFVVDFMNSKGSLQNTAGAWGYSVLAGETADSKFRIVLPNYFGRVAKMQFPESDVIVKAISGHTLPKDPGISGDYDADGYAKGQARNSGFVYYGTNNKYNASWMMGSMFDSAGFPYLSGSQAARQLIPKHRHNHGTYETDTEPAHSHGYRGFNDVRKDNDTNDLIGVKSRGKWPADPLDYAGEPAGEHFHSITSGFSGYIGDYTTQNFGTTYDIQTYVQSGTGSGSNKFSTLLHFSYDTDSGIYSKFSNWLPYTKENSAEEGSPDTSGQKFISPPFKGTIMAINLKGVTNPNRGGSVIKDLHFVGGVPQCGEVTSNETNADMSWWSDARSNIDNDGRIGVHATAYVYSFDSLANFTANTGAEANGWWVDNFYEYGYKDMARNDDTMHPYTFVDSGNLRLTTQLDYNTYAVNDYKKYITHHYKTNITREDDFDI